MNDRYIKRKDNFQEIMNIIDMQIYDIRAHGLEPSRIILGIRVYKYLESSVNWYDLHKAPPYEYDAVIMGLPVTVDTANKNLISVSCGTEIEYDFENSEGKYIEVLKWQNPYLI